MRFTPGEIEGHWIIDIEPIEDHRGFFARSYSVDEFAAHGLSAEWPHSNLQFSPEAGTMRGIHYQVPPHSEIKLVRCTRGSVFDVAVDLRPRSPTYMRWSGVELRADRHNAVWVPQGCGHGYLTLEPDTEVFYMASARYHPESVRAVRHDDPTFAIEWPRPVELVASGHERWRWFTEEAGSELEEIALGEPR